MIMDRTRRLTGVAFLLTVPVLFAATSALAAPPPSVTVCHKPGTPAEQTLVLPYPAALAHLGHGDRRGSCEQVDQVIDADGTFSPGDGVPGAVDTPIGAPLASFPVTGLADTGLDWFDNDHDGQWTLGLNGDDLHSEDPETCPGAVRNGIHDLGLDCKVVDLDNSLADGQGVDCDLEVNVPFTEPHLSNGGCPSSINKIRYYDADSDGSWDDGEDIILDVNDNSIFD